MGGDPWYSEAYLLSNVRKTTESECRRLIKEGAIERKNVYLNRRSGEAYLLDENSTVNEVGTVLDGPNSDCINEGGSYREKEISPGTYLLIFLMEYRVFVRMDEEFGEEDEWNQETINLYYEKTDDPEATKGSSKAIMAFVDQLDSDRVDSDQVGQEKIQVTYNMVGVYTESGEEVSHKVRVEFPSVKAKKMVEDDPELLIELCRGWLKRNCPGERVEVDGFDLDCEGEYESADNDDVIVYPLTAC